MTKTNGIEKIVPAPALAGLLAAGPVWAADGGSGFLSSMELGGHLHTLAHYRETAAVGGDTDQASDIHVNSLELGLTASPQRFLDAEVVWLMEEEPGGGSPGQTFAVDQAFVTLSGNPRMLQEHPQRGEGAASPFYLQAGKFYAPFATQLDYHTFDGVAEPPTLALGETLGSGVRVGYYPDGVHVFAGAFGGSGQDGGSPGSGEEEVDDLFGGASLEGNLGQVTLQWMSNINNSIVLQEELGGTESGPQNRQGAEANPGYALYVRTGAGRVTLQASFVRVGDTYKHGAMAGYRPAAATGELTYRVNDTWEVTGVYHRTDDWPDHPERGLGAVVGIRLGNGVALAGQLLHRDYDTSLAATESEKVAGLLLGVAFGDQFGPLARDRAHAAE